MAPTPLDSSPLLLVNGKVFQSPGNKDTQPSFHSCMLVRDGLIRHVGSESDPEIVQARDGGSVQMRDLGGQTVLPGFIDGHLHILTMGQTLKKAHLEKCKSLADIRAAIKAHAEAHPSDPRVMASGWMNSMTPDGVHHSMLDDLDPRPIYVDSKDLHSGWLNAAAIAEIGCEGMADPEGGTISRDADGKATGEMSEAAVFSLLWPHLATIASLDERVDAVRGAVDAYHAAGYTGMIDMAMDDTIWDAVLELRRRGPVPMRISAYWLIKPAKTEAEHLAQVARAVELNRIYNTTTSPDCRVVGIKVVCDGIVDACTASLTEPYAHNALSVDPIWTPAQLAPVVAAADAAGLQVALHAIGDRTVTTVVDAIEAHCAPSRRPRVEHLELTTPADAARLGRLGITASVQPVHSDPAIFGAWPRLLGEPRCARAFAYTEFADGGATLALGTDAPTAPNHPLQNLYVATTRRSAREPGVHDAVNSHFALDLCQAAAAATRGAAYSCFLDGVAGSLEAGKKADFVVVDMRWEPEALLGARVLETWFEGTRVYEAPA
ncbi:hypothetical protein RB595_004777 [Gaeumannomyces hyphopodioides]